MGFFNRMFSARANADDPTAGWAAATGPAPQVSFESRSIGTPFARLPFGGHVSEGRFLGRADDFTGGADHFTLTYYAWGLGLSFEGKTLAEVAYRIGARALAHGKGDTPATPTGPDGLPLTAAMTEGNLLARFGAPESRQDVDTETILYYAVGPLVSEFLLDEQKRLEEWTVYLD